MSRRISIKRAALASLILLSSTATYASSWIGGNANWTSNANPGWNSTGVPDAIGAIATHAVSTVGKTTQNKAGGVIVGAITVTHASNALWTIQNDSGMGILVNQDGAGTGFATFTNNSTSAGTGNCLYITGTGAITLQDDLHLVLTGSGSSNVNGAIQIDNIIDGTGNLTLNSSYAVPAFTTGSAVGAIRFTKSNTFTGNTTIENGLVVFAAANPFGSLATNQITLGVSGTGNNPYLISQAAIVVPNNIVVAPNDTGTSVIGTAITTASGAGYSGTISIGSGSNFYLSSKSGAVATDVGLDVSGVISGSGNLLKSDTGIATLANTNTYTGKTSVVRGTLRATSLNSISSPAPSGSSSLGAPTTIANGTIDLGLGANTGALAYFGAGETTDRVINLAGAAGGGTIDSSGTGALVFTSNFTATGAGAKTLTLTGTSADVNSIAGAIVDSSAATSLTKSGAGSWIISNAANTYSGTTTVSAGTLEVRNGALGTGSLALAGTLLLGSNDSETINVLSGAGAINTTSAVTSPVTLTVGAANGGGIFSGSIANSGGSGALSIAKNGSGVEVLSGTNSYTGTTTVNGGVLEFATPASLYNGNEADWTNTNIVVNSGAVLAFYLGGATGFTAAQIDALKALGTATGGLKSGSYLGLDTINGSNDYASTIGDTNSGANSIGLAKLGTNTLTLYAANTYTGRTRIDNGTLSVYKVGSVGSGPSAFGAQTTAASGTISLGYLTTTGTLLYNGAGETTNRIVDLAGASGGGAINSSGTGALVFTSNFTATGSAAKTLTLTGTNVAANTIAGAIVDGTAATSVTKSGAGQWVLSGANTYTGATAASAGTLLMSGSFTTPSLAVSGTANVTVSGAANSATTLTVSGGTFNLTGSMSGLTTSTFSGTSVSTIAATSVLPGTVNVSGASALLKYDALSSIGGSGRTITTAGITAATYALDQATLDRVVQTSTGVIALGANSSNNLDFTGFTSLSLGAIGNVTYSGTITPDASTARLGGGGGTLTFSSAITGGNSLVVGPTGSTGTVKLTTAQSYSGTTTLNGGTLVLDGGNNTLPTTTLAFNAANAVTTATLAMGANNQTLAALTFPTAGAAEPAVASTLNITGTGKLTINGLLTNLTVGAGGTTALDSATGNRQILNMSGLHEFEFNNSAQNVSFGLTGNRATKQTNVATVNFATINTITASNLGFANSGGGAGGGKTIATLGQTNVWNVNTLDVGLSRADADIRFATGLVSPTIKIRNTDGVSPVTLFTLGNQGDNSTRIWDDVVDFSAGTTDASITTMVVGSAEPGSATRDGQVNATFIMGTGNFTVNDLTIGAFRPSAAGFGTDTTMGGLGIFTLNNAAGTLIAPTITLGDVPVAVATTGTSKTATGTLNVLNGLVKSTTITRGSQVGVITGGVVSTARLDFTGGTVQNTDGANLAINDMQVRLLSNTGTRTFNASGSNTITTNAGTVISGVGSFTKAGTGTMILNGVNTHTGGSIVNEGTLMVAGSGAFSGPSGQLATNGTGIADLNGTNQTVGILNGTGGTILNNALSTNSILTVGGGNASGGSYSGSITDNSGTGGTLSLTKTGTGTVTLAGVNTYTGPTTVTAGSLQFAKTTALYNDQQGAFTGAWNDTNIVVESGGTLGFLVGGVGADDFTDGEVITLAAMGSATGGFKAGSNLGLNPVVPVYTWSHVIADSNGGLNSTGLTKLGPNTLILTGANTYTGSTIVNEGTLQFNSPTSIGGSGASIVVNFGSTAAAGYAIDQAFLNRFVGSSTGVIALGGDSSENLDFNSPGLVAASLGAIGTRTYSGTLTPNGTTYRLGGGGGNLTVTSQLTGIGNSLVVGSNGTVPGTVVLSNANDYTGMTTVNAGTLRITGSHTGGSDYNIATSAGTTANVILDGGSASMANYMFVGRAGGVGTYTQVSGTTTLGIAGTEDTAFTELYLGYQSGASGTIDIQSGTYQLNGWANIGRNNATGVLNNSGTVNVTRELRIGAQYNNETAGGNATVNNNSGAVLSAQEIHIARGNSTGTLNQAANSSVTTTGALITGYSAGGTGTYNMNGGTINAGILWTGFGGNGVFNQNNGTISLTNWYTVGEGAGSTGTHNMSGGSITTGENFVMGYLGNGRTYQTGGNINVAASTVLGWQVGASGTYEMSAGTSLSSTFELDVGIAGTGNFRQFGGSNVANTEVNIGYLAGSSGSYVIDDGQLVAGNWIMVGRGGTGSLTQNGGFIVARATSPGAFGVGVDAGSKGTFTMNHGSLFVIDDWFVSGVDGTGTATILNDSVITANTLSAGQYSNSNGTITINNPTGSVTITDVENGSLPNIVPTPLTGNTRIGVGAGSTGTLNQIAGTVTVGNNTTIGETGNGTFNMSGGTYNAGDNFRIGLNDASTGLVTQTGGAIVVVGNEQSGINNTVFGTGNFIVGRNAGTATGSATYNMSGGTLDLQVASPSTGTYNSASFSFANNVGGLGHELDKAKDANLYVGERSGTGTLDQSGGTINVGANVIVGGFNATTFVGGTGTITIRDTAQMHVGVGSPTGGDLVLGSPAIFTNPDSTSTINLQGGLLDVAHGSGMIASGGGGTLQFNFTGGTLKVKEWNSNLAGGNLGTLTQNGAGSLLDVTGNSTTLHSGYALGAGTATVTGQTLTIDAGMTDLTGTGVVNVNTGGALISNNVRAGALNLANGTATIRANGGVAGASKVETLSMTGTSKLDLKDNDLVVGNAVNVTAVRDQIKLGKTINAATGITSDQALFGSKTGFGYAMGNDPNLSPLLTNSSLLTGQSFDADSVLVKYTFLGDADLDGDTDLNDLGKWASNFTGDLNNPAIPAKFWTQGDFDYDGDTDLNDLGKWSSNFTGDLNGGAGSLIVYAPGASASAVSVLNGMGITVVPEPSTFVLAGVGLAGLAIAARRKKRA